MINQPAKSGARNFLRRLHRNEAGNTLAIVAAALVPMTAMVGGGVDMSRGYMAQARLQQACDAAVLAGRKAAGDNGFTEDAEARARTFFDANFPAGFQSTTDRQFDPGSLDGGTTVTATASAVLPTIVMKIFGKENIKLTASCDARLEVNNSDIMMVLDTTGSMVCSPSHTVTQCQTYISTYGLVENRNGTTSRMAGLKSALLSFNSILDAAAAGTNVRIRYGFVPYSGTVNVGKLLYAASPSYLTGGTSGDNHNYQSRRPVYYSPIGVPINTVETYNPHATRTEFLSIAECNKWGANAASTYIYSQSGSYPSASFTPSPSGNPTVVSNVRKTYSSPVVSGTKVRVSNVDYYPICKRNVATQTYANTYSPSAGSTFSYYEHNNVSVPVHNYVQTGISGNTVTVPADNALSSPRQANWAGCIEERATVASSTYAYDTSSATITPSGARDLDIDTAPNSSTTKWRPYWPEISYYRPSDAVVNYSNIATSNGYKSQVACPRTAQLLTQMSVSSFTAYTNSLFSDGGTYHDAGAIWGARLSSPDGIFAANVTETPANNSFVSRHMIIMTDGQIDAGTTYHSMYGIEQLDRKVTADGSTDQDLRHERRFSAMCEAVKAKGIRIWVIAFSTGLSTALTDCASTIGENADGTDKKATYTSSNSSALNQAFVEIAQSIADLRLSK